MPALHQLVGVEFHVVAQVVEAEFVVGAVSDVGVIGFLALFVGQAVNDDAGGQAQGVVQLPHPLGVAAGQVVVDRDHVHALAGHSVEHHGQGGDQGLACAGFHFGYFTLVEDHAPQKLHIVVAHPQ